MIVKSYEDLLVYQRAYGASLEVHKASLMFPQIEQRVLADQLRRSSKSICGNIAEGFAKQAHSIAEYRRYLIMAIGSADEVRVWLKYSLDFGYIDLQRWQVWHQDYQEIARMLFGLHRNQGLPKKKLIPDS